MINKLSNKTSVLIAIILALCLSMAAFVSLATKAYADETLVDEKPTANVVLDMDGTSATLEAEGGVNDKNFDNAIPGLFTGAQGETKMVFTNNDIAVGGTVTVKFGKLPSGQYVWADYVRLAPPARRFALPVPCAMRTGRPWFICVRSTGCSIRRQSTR